MDLVLRTTFVFLLIMLVTRAVGKRELNSLAPFDLIMLVVIGDLVQQGVTQSDYSLTGVVIVLSTLTLLTVLFSYVSFRSRPLRRVLEGEPLLLIEHGELLERNLKRERLTKDEIETEARIQQIGDLSEVRFAVLETNGDISFVKEDSGTS
jgi:uncharacterized membrane protein YcaP (DUF421 family)